MNNIVSFTNNAIKAISKYSNSKNKYLQISINSKYDSSYIVHMDYVLKKYIINDLHVIHNIYIDKHSVKYLKGSNIDYYDTLLCKKFIFNNKNYKLITNID